MAEPRAKVGTQPGAEPCELTLSAHAHGDGIGTLLSLDGRLYRAIHAEHEPFYRGLFESGLIGKLVERGLLVGSSIADLDVPGCELVIEHQRLPFVTYPTQWCGAMLRAAAVATLDLQIELLAHSATLLDAHGWNIIFDGTRPVMVDLTAIGPDAGEGRWPAENDFNFCMRYPALLASRGRGELARLMTDTTTVRDADLTALLPYALASRARHLLWRTKHRLGLASKSPTPLIRRLTKLRDAIAGLQFAADAPAAAAAPQATATLEDQLKRLAPADVLTVNCNGAAIPTAIAGAGFKVVACGADERQSNALYERARVDKLDILPLLLDVYAEASAFGSFDRAAGPIARQLRCDLVIAQLDLNAPGPVGLAKTDQRLQTLAAFARKAVWVQITGPDGGKSGDGLPDLELAGLLDRHARAVTRLEGTGPGVWYLCEL